MKGIFDSKNASGYDDDITARYHFPNRYLNVALQFVGDWIIYREPRRNAGRSGYVAVAQVAKVEPDTAKSGFSYARMSGFLSFDATLALDAPTGAYEALLRAVAPAQRGRTLQGKSVRSVSDDDFSAIVRAGLNETLSPENAIRLELDPAHLDVTTEGLVTAPIAEQERQITQILLNRKIRDANFRRQVIDAYDGRCAVTGIRMINAGGKAEAQAAHIWSVKKGGPDVVTNGIALSATAHWVFDRHLISLTDDLGLLVSHNQVPPELRSLFDRQLERIHLPENKALWPNPGYVRRHREAFLSA